ncbi:MAG: spore coat U domain-containing protein [Bacteroidota bacterium]
MTSRRTGNLALAIRRLGLRITLLCLACQCPGAFAVDLTEMALEDLLNVQFRPAALSSRFQVSAVAINSCAVFANDLQFSTYDPQAVNGNDASSTVTISCTEGSPYSIGLDAGIGPGAAISARRMSSNANTLDYSLFRDAPRTLNWGNTVNVDTLNGRGTGSPVDHMIFGRIWARQAVKAGLYLDTITVSVTY